MNQTSFTHSTYLKYEVTTITEVIATNWDSIKGALGQIDGGKGYQ